VNGVSGGFVARSVYYAPPLVGFARPVFGYNPFLSFGFGSPYFGGWGPAFGPPVVAVPVAVAVPVPVVVGGAVADANEPGDPTPEPLPLPLPPPKAAKGDFFVITPKKEVTVPEVTRVVPRPPRPVPPAIGSDPLKPPAPVRVELADPDPKKEAARLMKLGRESFAVGDYGRAAEFFERATTADRTDALAYFLHAQAQFAVGQYVDAVARIREGLARDPNWPKSAFKPDELYGDRPERFVVHVVALRKTLTTNPNQGSLEFLLGYQLWFSGEKDEANKLLRAAEIHLAAPAPVGLFKLP